MSVTTEELNTTIVMLACTIRDVLKNEPALSVLKDRIRFFHA